MYAAPPFDIIVRAKRYNADSLLYLLSHYTPYINYLANGNGELADILKSKLLEAIFRFNLEY